MGKRAAYQQQTAGRQHANLAHGLLQRGAVLQGAGRLDRAAVALAAAIRLQPSNAEALRRAAAVLAGLGRWDEAIQAWTRLRLLFPADLVAAIGLGEALLSVARPQEALVVLSAACETHPTNPALLRLNSRALRALGLRGPAIGALYMALDQQPREAGIHAELGSALHDDGNAAAALPHCQEALRLQPSAPHAATLSCVLIDLGRHAEALDAAEQGTRHEPDCLEALLNRSIALEGLGRHDDALAAARTALAAAPGNPVAQHHLASTLLGQGALDAEAWLLYEARLRLVTHTRAWPEPERRWTGGDVAGRTVLLHAEQGLGDTLQFVRYAPLVAARGARVVLVVQRPLLRLLQGTPGVDQLVAVGDALPAFDLYCPLLSLPGVFGTTLDTVPPPLPYASLTIPGDAGCARVGLVWAGNPGFVQDRKRSILPAALAPLTGVPEVTFHALKFAAEGMPPGLDARDLMPGVQDFADTAARIAGLDLVIAVDTAVAHLAATMGKPVWLLSRFDGCWRWLREGAGNPWYPGIRVFRQVRSNDWDGVVQEVRQALVAWSQSRINSANTPSS